jgi:RNase P/RNase MRP subunit p29
MHTIVSYSSKPLVALSAALLTLVACGRGSSAGSLDTSAPTQSSAPTMADTMTMVRGTVASATANQIVLTTDTNTVTVKVSEPLQVFDRTPGDMAQVKDNSFIGVTTVKQADGSERATEIHIFPDALRGLGEGSRMMAPPASGDASRMTNGSVSASRMSNGTVANATGSTLVVQYAGGSQSVTVPANTPVMEIKPVSKQLVAGDRVVIVARKQSDGSLAASKALLSSK